MFTDFASRCGCDERLANEDMCPHEIVAKGGYNKSFFKERHMRRECVEGSLEGWVEEDAVSSIDAMIGYELENLAPAKDDVGIGVGIGSADGDEMMADGTNLPPPLPPPGYLRPKSVGKVQPLAKKYVENVFTSAIDQYNGMTPDRKHLISSLVLDLQNQLTIDTTQSKSMNTVTSGHIVDVPSNHSRAAQTKKRLLPIHEVTNKHNKLKASATSQQEIGHTIQVNTKSRRITCSFCTLNHMITSCDKKQTCCLDATEYILTTDYPQSEDSLCNRIQNMPATEGCGKGSAPFDTLPRNYVNMNFIIHESRSYIDGSNIYRVSFIGSKGVVVYANVWITTKAMNSITTHTNRKKKYVYDQTIMSMQIAPV